MRTADLFHIAVLVLLGAVLVVRGRSMRRHPGDRGKRAVFLALLLLEVSFAIGLPQLYWVVFRALGEVPGLPQLLQHGALIASCHFSTAFARAVVERDQPLPRWRRWWLPVALALVTACYVAGPLRLGRPLVGPRGSDDTFVAVYVVSWVLCTAVAVVELLLLAWRNRAVESTPLRISMRLVGTACVLSLIHATHKVVYLVSAAAGVRLPWVESGPDGVQIMLLGPAVACFAVGLAVPALWPRLARRRQRRRLRTALAPLAEAVRAVLPPAPRSRDSVHRQVIEIRDALIGPLRPHLDAAVYETAHREALLAGCDPDEAAARAEAACIRAALRDHGTTVAEPHAPPPMTYAEDLDSDARWLARVSAAYRAEDRVPASNA
ncbi:hypothetical protein GCM10010492_50710 [Saccharothrix mutabilis subsp. mutabilis]|uniref:DUF6545 domain-containing protein n=1 Tax=Saccharothrix mutabilis subsp. mutabilis TaxID=66855 RepID=A0ABN0UBL6_9PSEU